MSATSLRPAASGVSALLVGIARIPALCPFLLASAACVGNDVPAPPGWTERDSAGIRIVENTTPAWSEETAWRVHAEPSLEIGHAEGEPAYLLHRIRQVLELRDGRIAVASYGSNDIRIFDSAGVHLRTIGRRGDGPGEFIGLRWIGELAGDSLIALDGRRISVFGPDGELARDHGIAWPDGLFEPSLVARFASGGILGYGGIATRVPAAAPGFNRGHARYFTIDDTGAAAQVIGDFVEQTGADPPRRVMYGPRAHRTVAADRMYFGPGNVFEIRVHDAAGSLLRIVRLERAPQAVTEADRALVMDSMEAVWSREPPDIVPILRARVGDPAFHPHVPAHGPILVDADGAIWVADYTPIFHPPARRWTVFDAEGHYLGDVVMPAGFDVHQIGDDFVLGRWTDPLEVEHVRLYALRKPGETTD